MKDRASNIVRSLFRAVYANFTAICGVVLLVTLFWYTPGFVTWMMDCNLYLIGIFCDLLPGSLGPQVEIALRTGLSADKAMLFAECAFAVRMLIGLPFLLTFLIRR